jgi:anti-sigma factor RsiW
MKEVNHERARKLLTAAAVEGITTSERDDLEHHLASCVECSNEAEALTAAIRSLRAFPVAVSPNLASRTKMAVRIRAQELQAERARLTPIWIASALSSICMIFTTPFIWQAFDRLGQVASIPEPVLKIGFLMWWFLPATVLAAAIAFRQTTENHWRHI